MFSKNEELLLTFIKKKPITIAELTRKFYGEGQEPFEARNRVANVINRIRAKAELNNLKWRIASEGGGRGGKSVWKETIK